MVHKLLDHYSIVDPTAASAGQASSPPQASDSSTDVASSPSVRFPGDDGGKSLGQMAQRDLEAALQLLAERAQYITGASGAAIALLDGDDMICRASSGPSAPELGAEVQVKVGLTGESVRTRQVLRCDDAEADSRVNRESCRALGIRSVMVLPLVREQKVIGVFELMANRAQAFEERDVTALERLADMVLTGLEHADAAKRAPKEIAATSEAAVTKQEESKLATAVAKKEDEKKSVAEPLNSQPTPDEPAAVGTAEPKPRPQALDKIRKCDACGFPVSEGRTLCVDCENARISGEIPAGTASKAAPEFLSELGTQRRQQSWLQSHFYTIGTILMVVLTLVLLAIRLR